MTAYGSTQDTVRRPETGWAQARRRDNGVRICLPAIADRDPSRTPAEPEGNIVRGED
ncbi:hypothetical protein O1Q96_29330 [Streptomyces sp. Qhu-G9]|uniref:hypothetical protein n=1 Tax=Streptomyces sp. Qhu-G9 TaxID=3452799 RepID=UPI0022AC238B|nr:hypothetical protein [Streptomyces aurantiacus]WAU83433.1 hypothetical protein O1Q96_29330 [Streptomyces aurantiacus]